jgi:hypothetical protein
MFRGSGLANGSSPVVVTIVLNSSGFTFQHMTEQTLNPQNTRFNPRTTRLLQRFVMFDTVTQESTIEKQLTGIPSR